MFFEPGVYDNFNIFVAGIKVQELARPGGFYPPPGGQVGSKRHSYNTHAYCCELDDSVCNKTGEPGPEFDA
jgi:hypothetical protein